MNQHMRICFVALKFPPSIGGSQIRAEKQAMQLHALGHEVVVVTTRHDRGLKPMELYRGVPLVRVGGIYTGIGALRMGRLAHIPIDVSLFVTLWRLRHMYDLIHVFQLSSMAGVAALIGKLIRKPVIVSIACEGPDDHQLALIEQAVTLMTDTLTDIVLPKVHLRDVVVGDITSLPKSTFGGKTILYFLRRSDTFYQALSTRCRFYLATHGFRAERIVHITGSVDTAKFCPVSEQNAAVIPSERNILCVARLEYSKGVDVLLHAWARLLHEPATWRSYLKLRLRIVGDGKLRSQMEHIAAALGIVDSIEFLGSRSDIVELLQQSWGFVLPSRWEGMPNALLEAMSCRLPCVATRVSGSEDIITDGVNGLLVEPENPAMMARALQRIIEDVNLAQRLGHEGRATVLRQYQLDTIIEQCLASYRRLLDYSGGTSAEITCQGKISSQVVSTKNGQKEALHE